MSETTPKSEKACVVSIEVDGRQRFIFETDKLREMLGASRIIDGTRKQAETLFKESEGLFLLSPVSGEIRAWCRVTDRDKLLTAAWTLREWLDERGVAHSTAYCDDIDVYHLESDTDERPDANLAEHVHHRVGLPIRAMKEGKSGADARPRCSLFAACEIHGLDAANEWRPGHDTDGESRRELVGFRASRKLRAWHGDRQTFYRELLKQPVLDRLKALRPNLHARLLKPPGITFSDLSDTADMVGRGDQYIAFICADADGMGKVLSQLSWNHADWKTKQHNNLLPWQRNREFSLALDQVAREALGQAVAVAAFPDTRDTQADLDRLERRAAKDPDKSIALNVRVLPQLCGGEDVWIVAAREAALLLAVEFGKGYAAIARDANHRGGIIDQAKSLARASENLTLSFGVAFAKAGYPVHAMVDAAEKLLKSAKALRKGKLAAQGRPNAASGEEQGCIDWHWIESSLSEDVDDARARWRYGDGGTTMYLTTKPWTIEETEKFLKAAELLAYLPRRKREQIESIVRLGRMPSLLAWESWWKSLQPGEQHWFETHVNSALPDSLRLPAPTKDPWHNLGSPDQPRWVTPLVDLLALQHVLGMEGKQMRPSDLKTVQAAEAADAPS